MPKNQTFENREILLEDQTFDGCQFVKCTFTYSGGTPATLTGCSFDSFDLSLTGPAANTLGLLTALYHGGFRHAVEATIENIRKNKHPGGFIQ